MNVENSESSTSAYQTQERKKSNLAFAFFCLDKDRAKDMEVFYAFCRLMDDIADEEGNPKDERRQALDRWKNEIAAIYKGETKLSPLADEMRDVITRRKIPQEYVQAIIDGVARDTSDEPFETFDDIRQYCYGVASAVGLASIHIFGFKNPRTIEFAKSLGYALQFTNILRDVVDDYRTLGRVYIPTKELEAFGVKPSDLADPAQNPNCKELFRFMHFRAKHFFNKSRRLLAPEDKKSLTPALIMWAIYEKILDSLAELDFNIPAKPLKISKPKKIILALRAIRDAKKPEQKNKKFGRAAVLGGGIAGCTTALRLAQEGFDVSLYEARASLGGRASSIEWGGAKLDNGSHALMGCYKNMFRMLKTLGTDGAEYFAPVGGMDFLFPNGKKFEIKYPEKNSSCLNKFFSFLSYIKLEGFANASNLALLVMLKLGAGQPSKDEIAIDYLKRKGVKRAAIDAFWQPFCISALNTPLEDSSARLMISTLQKCVLKGGDSALLYLPQKPINDAIAPRLKIYIEGVGGKIYTSETVKSLNISDGKITAIATDKCDMAGCDYVFSAIGVTALNRLIAGKSKVCENLSKIKGTDILNIYFTTSEKIIDGDYACLVDSRIHWLFDHSMKLDQSARNGKFLYGATVSASTISATNAEIEDMLKGEIKKFCGKENVLDSIIMRFAGATISADIASEAARPHSNSAAKDISNLTLCGDWIQTSLPCTMESAAKSAYDIVL